MLPKRSHGTYSCDVKLEQLVYVYTYEIRPMSLIYGFTSGPIQSRKITQQPSEERNSEDEYNLIDFRK